MGESNDHMHCSILLARSVLVERSSGTYQYTFDNVASLILHYGTIFRTELCHLLVGRAI